MTLGRLLSFSVWESVWESLQGPPRRERDFILSPRGLLQERPFVAQPMPGPQGLLSLHTVGAHRVGAQ